MIGRLSYTNTNTETRTCIDTNISHTDRHAYEHTDTYVNIHIQEYTGTHKTHRHTKEHT